MSKELSDRAWTCLPREFKEEVKAAYTRLTSTKYLEDGFSRGMKAQLETLFGIHNLTSDAEGEEMLTVSRKKVQEIYRDADNLRKDPAIPHHAAYWNAEVELLQDLFGSKCLPDETADEDNFVSKEPKFKVGECAMMKGRRVEIIGYSDHHPQIYRVHVFTENYQTNVEESDLEPYTEPKEEVAKMKPIDSKISVYLATKEEDEEFRLLLYKNGFKWKSGVSLISDSCWLSDLEDTKIHYICPDKIVAYYGDRTSDTLTFAEFKKRYFRRKDHIADPDKIVIQPKSDEPIFIMFPRLKIAAMAMAGLLASGKEKHPVKRALELTDALIAEVEKGGNE